MRTEVLERQVAEPLHGLIDLDLPAFDLLQQLSQVFRLNGLLSFKKLEIRVLSWPAPVCRSREGGNPSAIAGSWTPAFAGGDKSETAPCRLHTAPVMFALTG